MNGSNFLSRRVSQENLKYQIHMKTVDTDNLPPPVQCQELYKVDSETKPDVVIVALQSVKDETLGEIWALSIKDYYTLSLNYELKHSELDVPYGLYILVKWADEFQSFRVTAGKKISLLGISAVLHYQTGKMGVICTHVPRSESMPNYFDVERSLKQVFQSCNFIFVLGNFNFLLDTSRNEWDWIVDKVNNNNFSQLLALDEKTSFSFFPFFCEGRIDFGPTYKYEPNSSVLIPGEVGYTDRILFWGKPIEVVLYDMLPHVGVRGQHKPVELIVKVKITTDHRLNP